MFSYRFVTDSDFCVLDCYQVSQTFIGYGKTDFYLHVYVIRDKVTQYNKKVVFYHFNSLRITFIDGLEH